MELPSSNAPPKSDIYSSIAAMTVDGTSSMLYNSAYVNDYDLPSRNVNEESNTVTASGSIDNVTPNPAYGNVNLANTNTAGYNHLGFFSLKKPPEDEIYSRLMWKNQTMNRKISCIAIVVSSLALVASLGALLAAIIAPLSANNEATQQAASAMKANNCTSSNTLLTNCTISRGLLQSVEAKLNASLKEIFQLNEKVVELATKQAELQSEQMVLESSINTLTELLGVTGIPTQATTALPASATSTVQPGTEAPTIDSRLDQLDSSISRLEANQNQLQQDQSVLQNNVTMLTSRINTPVNLQNGCYEETRECSRPAETGLYWRQCATGELLMDVEGHYTQNMWCEHRSRRFGIFQESAYLRPDDTNRYVRCVCDTTYPKPDEPGHFVIPNNEDADIFCLLVIVRCPLAKTLF